MKRLTITYDNTVLFDGEVEELAWQDSPAQVSVIGKLKRQSSPASPGGGGAGGGLMDLLAGVSKARTAEVVKERKRQLAAEDATAATVVYQEEAPAE